MHRLTRVAGVKNFANSINFGLAAVRHNGGTAIAETAGSALKKSCYLMIDFKIAENAPVFDAIQRMAAHNIGCLAVTEGNGESGRVVNCDKCINFQSNVYL